MPEPLRVESSEALYDIVVKGDVDGRTFCAPQGPDKVPGGLKVNCGSRRLALARHLLNRITASPIANSRERPSHDASMYDYRTLHFTHFISYPRAQRTAPWRII